jgi:hypothetical protein
LSSSQFGSDGAEADLLSDGGSSATGDDDGGFCSCGSGSDSDAGGDQTIDERHDDGFSSDECEHTMAVAAAGTWDVTDDDDDFE